MKTLLKLVLLLTAAFSVPACSRDRDNATPGGANDRDRGTGPSSPPTTPQR